MAAGQTSKQVANDWQTVQPNDWQTADGGADPAQAAAPESAPTTTLQKIGTGAEDLAKGVGEGALSTLSSADDWSRKHLPGFMTNSWFGLGKPEDVQQVKDLATPADTTQKVGKIGEQMGEFLVPGGAEEKIAAGGRNLLAKIPMLGKAAPTLATMGASALGAGAVNKLQGGSFGAGAAAGAAGAGIGAGLKKLAPVVAEKAMGIRGVDRAFNRTPGQAIMDETTGVMPGTISKQAGAKVGEYTGDLDRAARESAEPFDMQPARDKAQTWLDTATKRNNPSTMKDVAKIGQQLDTRAGELIPPLVPADEALSLRRGIDDLHGSFSPITDSDFRDRAVDATRGVMNDGLQKIVPDYKNLTSKISTLLPVAKRAGATDLNESLAARLLTRAGARTGAGFLGAAGGYEGYKEGGLPGAVVGGAAGMFGPELFTHPTTLMMGARALGSPALRKIVIPAAEGAGLHVGRSKLFSDSPQ